jgi:hypothetical protein
MQPTFGHRTDMLLRRFSKDGDIVPEEHKEIFARFKEMFHSNMNGELKQKEKQEKNMDIISSESSSALVMSMGNHMSRILNGK